MLAIPAQAFTSLYVFGDALSTTTDNTYYSAQYPKQYYGKRYSNGRVWVEVLAQRQGIPIATNWSYFDNDSTSVVVNVKSVSSIPTNALVVLWCNNSDLYDLAVNNGTENTGQWNTAISQDQTAEYNTIVQLHAKGARTIIMPNVVNLGEVPGFDQSYTPAYLNYIQQECIAYNVAFSNTLNQARTTYHDMTIYQPDFFSLLNNVLAHAGSYGLTNVLSYGEPIDAIDALGSAAATNGLGDNYVYWDELDPSAKFHEIIADTVQQQISPVQISSLTVLSAQPQGATSLFNLENIPVGLNGFIDGTTNIGQANLTWTPITSFSSTSTSQSFVANTPPIPVVVEAGGYGSIYPGSGSSGSESSNNNGASTNSLGYIQGFRLRFPLTWSWP